MSEPACAPALGIDPEEAERTAAIVARLLPPALVPVFNPRFTRSHLLYDEFVHRLTLRVFTSAGLAVAGGRLERRRRRGGAGGSGAPAEPPRRRLDAAPSRGPRPSGAPGGRRGAAIPCRAPAARSRPGRSARRAAPPRPRLSALVHAGRDGGARLWRVPPRRAHGRGDPARAGAASPLDRLFLQRQRALRCQQPCRRRRRRGLDAARRGDDPRGGRGSGKRSGRGSRGARRGRPPDRGAFLPTSPSWSRPSCAAASGSSRSGSPRSRAWTSARST